MRRFESLPSTIQRQAKGVKNQNPTCDLPCVFPADGRHRLSLVRRDLLRGPRANQLLLHGKRAHRSLPHLLWPSSR